MIGIKIVLLMFGAFLGLPLPVKATEVIYKLSNGDVISGKLIEEQSDEKHKIVKHPLLGIISVNVNNIVTRDTDSSEVNNYSVNSRNWNTNIETSVASKYSQDYSGDDLDINLTSTFENTKNELDIKFTYKQESDTYFGETHKRSKSRTEVSYYYNLNDYWSISPSYDYQFNSANNIGENEYLYSIGIGYMVFDTNSSRLRITPSISSHNYDGGEKCMIHRYCGSLAYANTIKLEYYWQINQRFTFEIQDNYSFANDKDNNDLSFNNLYTTLRYYPNKIGSNLYTSVRYTSDYHSITQTSPDYSLSFNIGTSF